MINAYRKKVLKDQPVGMPSYLCNSLSDFGTISNGKVSEFESFETAAFKLSDVVDAKLNFL